MVLIKNYPHPVSLEGTEKILMQMKKSICCIYLEDRDLGTGFFCNIPFKDKLFPALITNNHIINEKMLKEGKEILISLDNDRIRKKIKSENNMVVYTNEEYDITIIEINPLTFGIENIDFLELDLALLQDHEHYEMIYKGESIYLLSYSRGKSFVSYGSIKGIEEYNINHLSSTETGSSGAPILNMKNHKIIGIHKGSNKKYLYNFGTLLKLPIMEFINKNKDYLNSWSLQKKIMKIK
jgi:V8-like Glu-specific endopeptidase